MTVNSATNAAGKTIYLKGDNEYITCAIELSFSGNLKTYAEETGYDSIPLTPGQHTISVVSQSDELNLNYLIFTKVADYNAPSGIRKHKNHVKLYPNPVRNMINFPVEYPGEAMVTIYNLFGSCLLMEYMEGDSDTGSLNVSHLAPGMYMISIQQGDISFQGKFIKQ